MKKLLFILLIGLNVKTFAQNAIADLKFEEAEMAFNNADYKTTITKLDEFDKTFGSTTAKSLYLRIISQDKLFNASKLYEEEAQFTQLTSLRKNASGYLKAMESEGLDDKYRKIYQISEELKQFPVDKTSWLKEKQRFEASLKLVAKGAIAPNFSAPNTEGKTISLKENLGKKCTILSFWASWAKPSITENANILGLYNKFNFLGLNVIGLSCDVNDTKWKKTINDEGWKWPQVSNLHGWNDELFRLYHIRGLPSIIILDENGKIVEKDLRGEDLKNSIENLFREDLDKYYRDLAVKIDEWEWNKGIKIGGNFKELKSQYPDVYKDFKKSNVYPFVLYENKYGSTRPISTIVVNSDNVIYSYSATVAIITDKLKIPAKILEMKEYFRGILGNNVIFDNETDKGFKIISPYSTYEIKLFMGSYALYVQKAKIK